MQLVCFAFHSFFKLIINIYFFALSVETPKEERPELQKKIYKWNTKEEAKQAFKELLKEKVSRSVCGLKGRRISVCISQ